MALQNFYITVNKNGLTKPYKTPSSSTFTVSVKMRDNGESREAVEVHGWKGQDGRLYIEVSIDGKVVHQIDTDT